jgi:glycosyltransferase involved in cell wall biosynthesis
MHTISLIIPCYNEELNIQKGVLDKIGNYIQHVPAIKEVIISDDGSTDNTKKLIKDEYLHRYPLFRLLENEHKGKAQTLISAILSAKSDYVLFTDIDLATPIEEVEKMVVEIEKNTDIIIGSRSGSRKGAPLTRKIMALGLIFIRNFIIGLKNIRDTQCGFKAFRTVAAKKIISSLIVFKNTQAVEGSSVSAGFDMEFIFLATKIGFSIAEIPVVWKHVETKNVNFITDSIETMQDILRIKYYDITGKYKI